MAIFLQAGIVLNRTHREAIPPDHLNFTDVDYDSSQSRGTKLDLSFIYTGFKINRFHVLHLHGNTQIAGGKITQA